MALLIAWDILPLISRAPAVAVLKGAFTHRVTEATLEAGERKETAATTENLDLLGRW